jgi:hypothetical protein
MGRFDRQEPSSDRDTNFDAVAQKLRSTVESRVRGVVEAAVARGLAIEERARVNARKIEEESDRKSREMLAESLDAASETVDLLLRQADGVLRATESLHGELGRLIESFRSEVEPLRENLKATKEKLAGPAAEPEAEPPPVPDQQDMVTAEPAPVTQEQAPVTEEQEPAAEEQETVTAEQQPVAEAPEPVLHEQPPVAVEEPPAEVHVAAVPPQAPEPDDASREKVRRQLIRLQESGKRRADVALYLARSEGGEYDDMLDEIFGPEPPAEPEREEPAPAAEESIAPEPAEEPDAAPPPPVTPSAAPGDDRGREMVRRQLTRLRESGKRRADVEEYLVRFKRSDYKDLIDEVFEPQPSESAERLPSP